MLKFLPDIEPDKIRVIYATANVGVMKNTLRVLKKCRGKFAACVDGDDYYVGSGGTGGSVSSNTYSISSEEQSVTITPPTKSGYSPSYTITRASGGGDLPTVSGNIITIPANSYGNFTVGTTWISQGAPVTITGGTGISSIYLCVVTHFKHYTTVCYKKKQEFMLIN